MIKAFILDFDGVIIDSELNKFKDLQKILKSKGYHLKDNLFKNIIGKKTEFLLKENFEKISEKEIKEIVEKRRSLQLSNSNERLISGIKELIKFLKFKGLRLAITTGTKKEIAKKILKQHNIFDSFELVVGGEDFIKSKPHPEGYLVTLKKLELNPFEVIVIEDSLSGVIAAKNTGCKVFAIETYFNKSELKKADNIFKNHLKILEYLKKEKL